jgi:hypothetical protein
MTAPVGHQLLSLSGTRTLFDSLVRALAVTGIGDFRVRRLLAAVRGITWVCDQHHHACVTILGKVALVAHLRQERELRVWYREPATGGESEVPGAEELAADNQ